MKKFVISFITLISGLVGASGQTAATEHYFPYPMVPDNLTTLQQRCSFLVYNFWNFCDFKSAFSSLDKMEGAFADFVSFMPYASADTVEIAVTNLLDKVKKSPAHTLALARMARAHLYADSADIISEQVYLPFAQAVVANKKIPAADREPFAREAKIMANTRVGQRIPDLEFTLPDGTVSKVSQHLAPMVLLVFTGPDCSECSLDRVRLSADYALKKMMDSGRLSIINLYVGAPDATWTETVASVPEGWTVGLCPEAAEYFDLLNLPSIAYLNRKMEVIGKNFSADDIIESFRQHVLSH